MTELTLDNPEYGFYLRLIQRAQKGNQDDKEWMECALDNDPELIGQYLSALGNIASIVNKDAGYILWGIDDKTHELIGTSFNPATAKKGGELLESYLGHMLSKNARFQFYRLHIGEKPIVVAVSSKATAHPLSFAGTEYIRVGSSLKKLRDFPELERVLWLTLSVFSFESDIAVRNLSPQEIDQYIDLSAFYRLLHKPFPHEEADIVKDLTREGILKSQDDGRLSLRNAGVLAFGRDLSIYPALAHKAIRVLRHQATSLSRPAEEREFQKGYALCIDEIIDLIDIWSGREERIVGVTRQSFHPYPIEALREMVANAFIHQDLTMRGSNILIHVYADKVVVQNPGELLCDIRRSIDTTPKSRNEILATLLRHIGIVEEQGSGFDRIEENCADNKMPSLLLESDKDRTVVTLFRRYGYPEFSQSDLIRTCYTYTCLRHYNGLETSNKALRERLGIDEHNAATVSRILKRCVEEGWLKPAQARDDKRMLNYVPYYA